MVIGDFKNVLKMKDRIGGNLVQEVVVKDLKEMIEVIGLYEHDTKGNYSTWSNIHINGMIYSRIDRAICNKEWFVVYPYFEIDILQAIISYHNPLKVNMLCCNTEIRKISLRFKFMNCVVDRHEFMDVIHNI